MRRPPSGFRWLIPPIGSLAVLAAPMPAALGLEGQRVLAVLVLAIGLWGLEALPAAVTGVVTILALVLTHAVAGDGAARAAAAPAVGCRVAHRADRRGSRLVIPNITRFVATTIPIAMSVAPPRG